MTNRLMVLAVTGVLLLLSPGGSTYAHHGFVSWFDMSRSTTVKGTVTGFDWTNPHAYIYFDVKNEKGVIEKWTAELGAIAMLTRAGWRKDTLKAGDPVSIEGFLAKDGSNTVNARTWVLPDGKKVFAGNNEDGGPAAKP